MKKALLVFILILFAATGVFADVFVSGQVHTVLGVLLDLDNPDADHTQWRFNTLNLATYIQANARTEQVNAWVRYRFNNSFRADASADLGLLSVSVGYQELPFFRPSRIWIWNDSAWGIGATATEANAYIYFRTMGFYTGLSEAGNNRRTVADAPFPGFFAGYDMPLFGTGSAGLAFSAIPAKDADGGSVFPFMGNVFVNFGNVGPANIRVNAGLYSNPEFGFWAITNDRAPFHQIASRTGNEDLMVVEGMIEARIPLDIATFTFNAATILNLDSNREEIGLQLAASAVLPLASRFNLIAGLMYTVELGTDSLGSLLAGSGFLYSF